MSKLITEMGASYFFDKFNGAYFRYEDDLVTFRDRGPDYFAVSALNDGSRKVIPFAFFEGFSVFKWPTLGYRRLSDNLVARIQKHGNGTGGFRINQTSTDYTPLSNHLLELGLAQRCNPHEQLHSVFFPKFDSADQLDALFSGDMSSLVLSENVVVESSLRHEEEDVYDILYRGNSVATVTPDRVVEASSSVNKAFARSVLNV